MRSCQQRDRTGQGRCRAFAIDAWWEDRRDLGEERRVPTSLGAEFQANVEDLPRFIDSHQRTYDYGLEPLELPCDNEVMGLLAEVAWTAGEAARELRYLESGTREIVALLDREIARLD